MSNWLTTEIVTTKTNGMSTARNIVMSGTDTTLQELPTITRTSTRTPTEVDDVTHEDEGCVATFALKIRSLLGTVPPGADNPPSPI